MRTPTGPDPACPPGQAPVVVLFGFMGAGKSAVGERLARALGVQVVDSDDAIVAEQGRSIADIFATDGEPAFRALEHTVVARLLTRPGVVLALGGGAAMHPATQALLRAHPCTVHLAVSLPVALARCGDDPTRPMLRHPDLATLHARRTAAYSELATHVIDTDRLDADQVCRDILEVLADRPTHRSHPDSTRRHPPGSG